jgi:glycosyltransferase involved in cell wall biosynthesis
MRICIVTVAGHGIGGMQDHTRDLAKGLAADDHDVHVVTTRHPDGLSGEDRDGARWHFVEAAHHHPRLPRRDPAWLTRSHEMFLRLQTERPFDVIHSESTSAIGLVRRGVHRQVPMVAKFHGSGLALTRGHVRRLGSGDAQARVREAKGLLWLFGVWFQHGQLYRFRPCVWMVPSEREFDDTRRSHLLKADLGYVVRNGIDTDVFAPRPQRDARADLGLGDAPLFVAAGRLEHEKGTHHAIRALAPLGDRGQPAMLVVIGSGPERDSLEQLSLELGLGSRVSFIGAQPHDVLARYLAAADAFVFPTERIEAAPLMPLQALACGTPVIASGVGGVPELLGGTEEWGLLVRPGEPEALASAMQRVLVDADLRHRLRRAGVERVRDGYTLQTMVEQTLSVYEVARRRQQG